MTDPEQDLVERIKVGILRVQDMRVFANIEARTSVAVEVNGRFYKLAITEISEAEYDRHGGV